MAKSIYITATERNTGKTSLSIGIMRYLIDRGYKVGFIKPVAQRYVQVDGGRYSEDAVLLKKIFNLPHRLDDMSPVVVESGITELYILKKRRSFKRKIVASFRRIAKDSDFVIVEGTGHAGVGSCLDMSNPEVAKAISASVLMVAEGGIGSTIDRIALNRGLFKLKGVMILGVVVNKVKEYKYDKIQKVVGVALKSKGMRVYGFVPYVQYLAAPTITQIASQTKASLLSGEERLEEEIDDISVATMEPHAVLRQITESRENLFLITSSDRVDVLLAIVAAFFEGARKLKGVLLSGANLPPANILHALKKTGIPVLISSIGVYTLASMLSKITVKTTPEDKKRISALCSLAEKHIEIDHLLGILEKEREPVIGLKGWLKRLWRNFLEFFRRLV